jgi:hypothetical protein
MRQSAFKPNGTVHVHHGSDVRDRFFQTAGFTVGTQNRRGQACLQREEYDLGLSLQAVQEQGQPDEREQGSKSPTPPGGYRSSPKHELKRTAQGRHRQDDLNGQKIVFIP